MGHNCYGVNCEVMCADGKSIDLDEIYRIMWSVDSNSFFQQVVNTSMGHYLNGPRWFVVFVIERYINR